MDKVLLVDIGNTSVKWAMMDLAGDLNMVQVSYPNDVNAEFFIEHWKKNGKPSQILVSCVASDNVWSVLENAVLSLWGIKAKRVISTGKGFGVENAYVTPESLGSDRWCALIGAYHAFNNDVVVIDCGSAITIDIVNKSGKHLGGYILPGLKMMKQSLGLQTAQIKLDNNLSKKIKLSPSCSTSACVEAGVLLAAVSAIETVIKQQLESMSEVKCIFTGGDACVIEEYLSCEYISMPELVLLGLAYMANNK